MGHQILAINRGEREGILKAAVELDREKALIQVRRRVLMPGAPSMAFVRQAAEDAYDRLLPPAFSGSCGPPSPTGPTRGPSPCSP